jgi:hypothetical protein
VRPGAPRDQPGHSDRSRAQFANQPLAQRTFARLPLPGDQDKLCIKHPDNSLAHSLNGFNGLNGKN